MFSAETAVESLVNLVQIVLCSDTFIRRIHCPSGPSEGLRSGKILLSCRGMGHLFVPSFTLCRFHRALSSPKMPRS